MQLLKRTGMIMIQLYLLIKKMNLTSVYNNNNKQRN